MHIAFRRVRCKTSPVVWREILLWTANYCIGEKGAGSKSLLSCVIGLTEPLGGQTPFSRVSARTRARSSKLLYAHTWMKLLVPPYSEYQQPASDENFKRSGIAALHASKTCGMPSGG